MCVFFIFIDQLKFFFCPKCNVICKVFGTMSVNKCMSCSQFGSTYCTDVFIIIFNQHLHDTHSIKNS